MWARCCVGCGVVGPPLCPACVGDGPLFRASFEVPFVRGAWALHAYDSGIGRAVVRAKGTADRGLARRLAWALAQRSVADPAVTRALGSATLVSWVPSPWTRRVRRGFSLPALCASAVASAHGLPVGSTLSLRPGPRQARAVARQRRVNLAGRMRARGDICGGRVVLVDDVVTTGTSASIAARELLGSGADSVVVIALCLADKAGNGEQTPSVQIL